VAVSMLGGIRTEEARALRWSEVDLEAGPVAVCRPVRRTGETKTEKSRRVFQMPEIAVEALRDLVLTQAAARAEAGTEDRRRPKLSSGSQLGYQDLIDRIIELVNSGNDGD
jgi:integrase